MSNNRTHPKRHLHGQRDSKKRSARTARLTLVIGLCVLAAAALALIFKLGGSFWPAWLVENRMLLIAVFGFLVLFIGLLSPLLLEVVRAPRSLSGPGKNPEMGDPGELKR